jgi:AcrR family transcriptional regulator
VSFANDEYVDPPVLSPGARALVEACKQLLMSGGMEALRVEKVSIAAGQNPAMIRYYFGGKDALVAAAVDSFLHEAVVDFATKAEALPEGEPRLGALVDGNLDLVRTPGFLSIFEVLPSALRNDGLRERLARLYVWYREVNAQCLDPATSPPDGRRLQALASLLVAMIDGLAVQHALDPEALDFAALGEVVKEMLGAVLGPSA